MSVIVDTSVWSLFLRRHPKNLSPLEQAIVDRLVNLIEGEDIVLLGPIRQEILSGIVTKRDFEQLRLHLRAWVDELTTIDDFEEAVRCRNRYFTAGIVGSLVDSQICAVALRLKSTCRTPSTHHNSTTEIFSSFDIPSSVFVRSALGVCMVL
jgi:predicted nucleic acid-binding protein